MAAKMIEECAGDVPGRVYIVRDDGTACMVWSPHWQAPIGWIQRDSGPGLQFAQPRVLGVVPEAARAAEVRRLLKMSGRL